MCVTVHFQGINDITKNVECKSSKKMKQFIFLFFYLSIFAQRNHGEFKPTALITCCVVLTSLTDGDCCCVYWISILRFVSE